MANWLDKYQVGGNLDPLGLATVKKDATQLAAPKLKLTKAQLEKNKAINKQVMANTKKAEAKAQAEEARARTEEVKARRNRIATANAMQDKQFDSAENFAIANSAIGDKLRFSEYPNVIDDYVNPFTMFGDLASGLGKVPLNIKQGNYGEAAMNIANPIITGAGETIIEPLAAAALRPVTEPFVRMSPYFQAQMRGGMERLKTKVQPIVEKYVNPVLEKYVDPIVYRNQIAELKNIHADAPNYFNNPEIARRLQNLDINDPSKLQYPELTFHRTGSSFSPLDNVVNIDLSQRKKLNDIGHSFTNRSVYDHEMGHWLQKESYVNSGRFDKDLADAKRVQEEYVEKLKDWKTKQSSNPNEEMPEFPLESMFVFPTSKPTAADAELKKLTTLSSDELSDRALEDALYFKYGGDGVEAYPFLREMKRDMIDKGFLKDEFDRGNVDIFKSYFESQPKTRIPGFTKDDFVNRLRLQNTLSKFPSVAPIIGAGALGTAGAIGASDSAPQQRDGGELQKYQPGGKVSAWTNGLTAKQKAQLKAQNEAMAKDPEGTSLQLLDRAMSYPQRKVTQLITGKNQFPSEALGIKNPLGAFATDFVLDPLNVFEAPALVKLGTKALKGGKNAVKAAKALNKATDATKSSSLANASLIKNLDLGAIDSYIGEFVGNKIYPGKASIQKEIDAANQWTKDWVNNPFTQMKIQRDLSGKGLDMRHVSHAINYEPNAALYPLSQQGKDLKDILLRGKTEFGDYSDMIHQGNLGVSYRHGWDPYYNNQYLTDFPRQGTWVSTNPAYPKNRRFTAVHENFHDWLRDYLLKESGQFSDIQNSLKPEFVNHYNQWHTLRQQGVDPASIMGKRNSSIGYLSDPTEVHARIGELRYKYGLKPDVHVTTDDIKKMRVGERGKNATIDKFFFDLFKDDRETARMFNRLWAAPAAVGAGAIATQNLSDAEPEQQRNGGELDKFQPGGKIQTASVDSSKNKKAAKQLETQLPIYYGPMQFENCQGAGCSKIATTEIANTFGMNYADLHPQDAWYRRASVLKNKGKEIWNPSMGNDYSGFRVGDLISLDRSGDTYAKTASTIPGYTLVDNEGNEHVGEIVGRNKQGIPLVKHGSEHGKIYIQPITDLVLPDANDLNVPLHYKPQSVYRLAELENAEIKDKKFYTAPQPSIPVTWKTGRKLTANEKKYIDAINANAGKQQQMFGLSPEEAKMINTLGFGIFHNESNAGNTSWKRPIAPKMIGSELAHAFGRDASASLGDVQFKYDDTMYNADKSLTSIGRRMQDIGVTREGLSDWTHHRDDYNDEVNAVSALMSDYLNKFKTDAKYKYDPKKKTIYGDIPIENALINLYHYGPKAKKEKFLRNAKTYAKDALRWYKDANYTPETPKGVVLSKSPVAEAFKGAIGPQKKENGGWLDKYDDGGELNYNDSSVSFPPNYVGQAYDITGRDYSPAWGGQFQMGGSMPGAVGFMYARTGAPSKGPRRNQTSVTDASAQDGTRIKTNIPVPIDEIKKANASAEAFNKQYVQSPNFVNLLQKQGYTPKEIKRRQDEVLGMTNDDYTYTNFGPNFVYGEDESGKTKINYNQRGLGDWSNFGDIAAHEWGHVGVTDYGPSALKSSEQKLLYSKLNWPNVSENPDDFAHDIAPQENRADLVELRKALQDRGIYDSFKGGEFKQEHLDKLREKDPEYWNRSMRLYKDKDIVDLMNTIAANNPKQGMPVAQNGYNMSYYQNGLDFKPKSISKNGKKIIKDDRGQWAHPGEITEIGSNQITMQGVPYPVLGISDTGDMQMMYPNQEYQFIGDSVTEYPMMKQGGQLTKLDQLTNFTNYNTKQPGGWLDKYQD